MPCAPRRRNSRGVATYFRGPLIPLALAGASSTCARRASEAPLIGCSSQDRGLADHFINLVASVRSPR
jgi:hypothetical protein